MIWHFQSTRDDHSVNRGATSSHVQQIKVNSNLNQVTDGRGRHSRQKKIPYLWYRALEALPLPNTPISPPTHPPCLLSSTTVSLPLLCEYSKHTPTSGPWHVLCLEPSLVVTWLALPFYQVAIQVSPSYTPLPEQQTGPLLWPLSPSHAFLSFFFSLYHRFVTFLSHRSVSFMEARTWLCPLLYPLYLEQYLAHNRCSINAQWMDANTKAPNRNFDSSGHFKCIHIMWASNVEERHDQRGNL